MNSVKTLLSRSVLSIYSHYRMELYKMTSYKKLYQCNIHTLAMEYGCNRTVIGPLKFDVYLLNKGSWQPESFPEVCLTYQQLMYTNWIPSRPIIIYLQACTQGGIWGSTPPPPLWIKDFFFCLSERLVMYYGYPYSVSGKLTQKFWGQKKVSGIPPPPLKKILRTPLFIS